MSHTPTPSSGHQTPSPRRLKNEASQLRLNDPQLGQHAALNAVAKARGWSSYKAIERAWRANSKMRIVHAVTLTSRWEDKRHGGSGKLHAIVLLAEPWANFLPLDARRRVSELGKFHIFRRDRTHLVAPANSPSFHSCVHKLSKAARQLVFIDALRVLPASAAKVVDAYQGDPQRILCKSYPNQDHESLWFDPATGLHFILNEPYQIDEAKQKLALQSRKMHALSTREWTIHNPEGTLAQLIAPASDRTQLEALSKRGEVLAARFAEITFSDGEGQLLNIFR